MLHKIAATVGGGVSVAKAQCLDCYSQVVNVVSYPQSTYPVPLIERSGSNPSRFSSYVGNFALKLLFTNMSVVVVNDLLTYR